MPYFRVDKRLFAVGDEIRSAQRYYGLFTGAAKVVEDSLESCRPDSKVARTDCLFAFCDEKCARKHWSKMSGGKLYVVEILERAVLHCGDMALMDRMKAAIERGESIDGLASAYWRGELSAVPEIEILVSSAIVKKVLSTSETERLAHLKERWGFGP